MFISALKPVFQDQINWEMLQAADRTPSQARAPTAEHLALCSGLRKPTYCTLRPCLHTQVLSGIPKNLRQNNTSSTVARATRRREINDTEEQFQAGDLRAEFSAAMPRQDFPGMCPGSCGTATGSREQLSQEPQVALHPRTQCLRPPS